MMNNIQSVLLGALLLYPKYAPEVIPDLEVEHFQEELQPTFAAMSGFWNAKGTLDATEICGRYPAVSQSILDCVNACESECVRISSESVQAWAQVVQEQAALNRVQSLAFQMASNQTTYADLPDIYQQMGEALNLHSEKDDFLTVGDGIKNYIRHMDDKPRYIKTGLRKLDEFLHLVKGNFVIIGGRPSAGKTALSLQMACNMAREGHKVVYFSLETDPDTLIARIIANQIDVPLSAVKNKSEEVRSKIDRAADLLNLPLHIRSAAGKNAAWMKAQALRMKADVIFVDYLQLVRESKAGDRYQQITATSIALHELAQTTGIVVVALAQLNRNSDQMGNNGIPHNTDLRESGQIEQDADAIILLASDVTIKDHPEQKYYFGLSKNKEGQTSERPIRFNKQIQRFEEYEW